MRLSRCHEEQSTGRGCEHVGRLRPLCEQACPARRSCRYDKNGRKGRFRGVASETRSDGTRDDPSAASLCRLRVRRTRSSGRRGSSGGNTLGMHGQRLTARNHRRLRDAAAENRARYNGVLGQRPCLLSQALFRARAARRGKATSRPLEGPKTQRVAARSTCA